MTDPLLAGLEGMETALNIALLKQEQAEEAEKGLELAWGLISNAWAFVEREDGHTSDTWLKAAAEWRDNYA